VNFFLLTLFWERGYFLRFFVFLLPDLRKDYFVLLVTYGDTSIPELLDEFYEGII